MGSDGAANNAKVIRAFLEGQGERRLNVLRLIAIVAFYLIELGNYYGLDFLGIQWSKVESVTADFHFTISLLAGTWCLVCLAVWRARQLKYQKAFLKYFVTLSDIALLTAMLFLADGPKSPLIVLYFVVVAGSALRFHLDLVRFATASAGLSYVAMVIHSNIYRPELRIPNYSVVIFVASIIFIGVFAGQIIRNSNSLIELASEQDPADRSVA